MKDGQFRTDLNFISERPENIRAGQTYHINLQLGDPAQAILVPVADSFKLPGADGCTLSMKVVHLPRGAL